MGIPQSLRHYLLVFLLQHKLSDSIHATDDYMFTQVSHIVSVLYFRRCS